MQQALAHIALVVRDYDEAIAFYTQVLGFELLADEYQPEQGKRWVLVRPPGGATSILLARASNETQAQFIGDQAGGRVFLFLRTDDFWRDYKAYRAKGVTFVRPPKEAPYGTVAVFLDLYGNRWDLIEFAQKPRLRPARTNDVAAITHIACQAFAAYVPRIGMAPAPMTTDYALAMEQGNLQVLECRDAACAGFLLTRVQENVALYTKLGFHETHRATEHGLKRVYMERRLEC